MGQTRPATTMLAAAVLAVLGLTSCTDTHGPDTATDVGEVARDGDDLIGERVTVSAMISEALPGRAFVFAGGEYGDTPLLVLADANTAGLESGQPIAVTGTVRTFDYREYAGEYNLGDAKRYERFAGEAFVAAGRIDLTADTSES